MRPMHSFLHSMKEPRMARERTDGVYDLVEEGDELYHSLTKFRKTPCQIQNHLDSGNDVGEQILFFQRGLVCH